MATVPYKTMAKNVTGDKAAEIKKIAQACDASREMGKKHPFRHAPKHAKLLKKSVGDLTNLKKGMGKSPDKKTLQAIDQMMAQMKERAARLAQKPKSQKG